MKSKSEIVNKIRQLLDVDGVDRVGISDNYFHNIQGMIESLYWVIDEDVDDKLRHEIESII